MTSADSKSFTIDLWLLPYTHGDTTFNTKNNLAALSQDELERFHRSSNKRQREFLLSRLLLRFIMQHYISSTPFNLEVKERTDLPPYIPTAQAHGIHFNISHSHELIGIASTQTRKHNYQLGFDLEYIKPIKDFVKNSFFCNKQQQLKLEQTTDPIEKTALYYRYWTQKEACLKARQTGIGDHALKQIDFQPVNTGVIKQLSSTKYQPTRSHDQYQLAVYSTFDYQIKTQLLTINDGQFAAKPLPLPWQDFYLAS